jgi:phage head maturation protease
MNASRFESLVTIGGAIKALGNNRIGGYLVQFGDPTRKDIQGEFFSANTDFWSPEIGLKPVIYQHGFTKALGRRRIGDVTCKVDEVGLWAEGQLKARSEYEAKYLPKILDMVKAGKLGWSSGSANHLVETDDSGQILSWPIVEASITPTPADPRTAVLPLKALFPGRDAAPVTIADVHRLAAAVKAGRVLSAANWTKLDALAKAMTGALDDLNTLLESTRTGDRDTPAAKKNADASPAGKAERVDWASIDLDARAVLALL